MYRNSSHSPAVLVEDRIAPRHADRSAAPARIRRQRDFGVGYGSSSGYASRRSYAGAPTPYFRVR